MFLRYQLYVKPANTKYNNFVIPKRDGTNRVIMSPSAPLKSIQRKLAGILSDLYRPKSCVHAFVKGRSIKSNSLTHVNRKWVLNIDLEDFFEYINFGRVRGMFLAIPYNFSEKVSTILTQICCYENQLPQGAPTSPIVSNMICAKMDSELIRLARDHHSSYTRYADDITFSSKSIVMARSLVRPRDNVGFEAGDGLRDVIKRNGFKVNVRKVKLTSRLKRQSVTGLVVNEKTNVPRTLVRQVRAMIYAWRTFGLAKAESEHFRKYRGNFQSQYKSQPRFAQIVEGKLEFIRMITNGDMEFYRKLLHQVTKLDKKRFRLKLERAHLRKAKLVHVLTEGKSDVKYLKAALNTFRDLGRYRKMDIDFSMVDDSEMDMGDVELIKETRQLAKMKSNDLYVAIFDRDNVKLISRVTTPGKPYKKWSGKGSAHSFIIPVPSNRNRDDLISLEYYFCDKDLMRIDSQGRRLYRSEEFNSKSGRLIENSDIACTDKKLIKKKVGIIGESVFDSSGRSIALSKDSFAKAVYDQSKGFSNIDFSQFALIFNLIEKILIDDEETRFLSELERRQASLTAQP